MELWIFIPKTCDLATKLEKHFLITASESKTNSYETLLKKRK